MPADEGVVPLAAIQKQAAQMIRPVQVVVPQVTEGPVKILGQQINRCRSAPGEVHIAQVVARLELDPEAVLRLDPPPAVLIVGQRDIAYAAFDDFAIHHKAGQPVQCIAKDRDVVVGLLKPRAVVISKVDLADAPFVERLQLALVHLAILVQVLEDLHGGPDGVA